MFDSTLKLCATWQRGLRYSVQIIVISFGGGEGRIPEMGIGLARGTGALVPEDGSPVCFECSPLRRFDVALMSLRCRFDVALMSL